MSIKFWICCILIFRCGFLFSQESKTESGKWYSFENLDLIVKPDSSYQLQIFPLFNFEFLKNKDNHFISARGVGFKYLSGNWEIYSSAYDAQISNISGIVGDSTLAGLNYVRFKGETEEYKKIPSNRVDFDGADSYIKYSNQSLVFSFGKYPFIQNPERLNSLLFNGTNGSFTHTYFSYKSTYFEYEFLLGYLKHLNGIGSLSDKSIIYHKFQLNLFDGFRFYAYEAIMQQSHSINAEYLNPFIVLRSSDHYNFSNDNAVLAIGMEYRTNEYSLFGDVLVDDIDANKLGTGWFRNKIAGEVGGSLNFNFFNTENKLKVETVFVNPFTFSHRNQKLNFTQYGSPLGPELGPNSFKFQIQNEIKYLKFPQLKIWLGYEFFVKGVSTSDEIVGDDISIGHPDIFSTSHPELNGIPFSIYPKFLAGRKVATDLFSLKLQYEIWNVIPYVNAIYSTQDFIVPNINLDKGLYLSIGLKYRFDYFDRVRTEFW